MSKNNYKKDFLEFWKLNIEEREIKFEDYKVNLAKYLFILLNKQTKITDSGFAYESMDKMLVRFNKNLEYNDKNDDDFIKIFWSYLKKVYKSIKSDSEYYESCGGSGENLVKTELYQKYHKKISWKELYKSYQECNETRRKEGKRVLNDIEYIEKLTKDGKRYYGNTIEEFKSLCRMNADIISLDMDRNENDCPKDVIENKININQPSLEDIIISELDNEKIEGILDIFNKVLIAVKGKGGKVRYAERFSLIISKELINILKTDFEEDDKDNLKKIYYFKEKPKALSLHYREFEKKKELIMREILNKDFVEWLLKKDDEDLKTLYGVYCNNVKDEVSKYNKPLIDKILNDFLYPKKYNFSTEKTKLWEYYNNISEINK